jgi:hypothetical protein
VAITGNRRCALERLFPGFYQGVDYDYLKKALASASQLQNHVNCAASLDVVLLQILVIGTLKEQQQYTVRKVIEVGRAILTAACRCKLI